MSTQPKILVTGAAGRTGATTAHHLLANGFPVRAFVRRDDGRAAALRAAGAEVVVGDMFAYDDVRRALVGVQRAYHCPPVAANLLHNATVFALAAEDARLEVVALMSQWHPNPRDPSFLTREHWLANNLYRWMPSVDVVHINPGIFAFIYLVGLPAIVHFGLLAAPFGDGRNAPPSNEDIGRVAAAVLMDPAPHLGKSYRPTGPELLTSGDIAGILAGVLDRPVRYRDVPFNLFAKAALAQGIGLTEISQLRHYADAIRHDVYAHGAPTDHVLEVTGRPPEDFATIARRYVAQPALIDTRLKVGSKLNGFGLMVRMLATRAPDLDAYERGQHHPLLERPVAAWDNADWQADATRQQLHLLDGPVAPAPLRAVS